MFIRQPRSPASSSSAPVASMWPALFDTIRVEISGYLTQNVPPKPQQTSLSSISTQRQALDAGQQLRAAGA